MSASVLRSGGCNAFATTELPSQCAVEGVRRHWRSTRNKSSLSSVSSRTSRCGRSFPRCTSGESQEAAAHSRDSSLVTASPSKKSLRAAERQRADVARARRRWARANLPGEVAARAGYDFWGNQFRCHRAGGRRRRYSAAYRSPAEPADRSASRSECSFSAYFTPGSMRSARCLTPMKSVVAIADGPYLLRRVRMARLRITKARQNG